MRRKPASSGALLLASLILAAASPAPSPTMGESPSAQYDRCLAMTRDNPQKALTQAEFWRQQGGGFPAEHCAGVALIGLARYAEAAQRLESLAAAMMQEPAELRAATLEQAGEAWIMADQPDQAKPVFDAALAYNARNPELLIDRAAAYALGGHYWEAIDDLNSALDIDPNNVTALIYRASAYRNDGGKDGLELALADANKALQINPGESSGLLERGNILRLKGNPKGARADWEAVIKLAPDSPAGRDARNNLSHINENNAAPALMTEAPQKQQRNQLRTQP
jgi:tetratricopeptide (TPR) repeat protein